MVKYSIFVLLLLFFSFPFYCVFLSLYFYPNTDSILLCVYPSVDVDVDVCVSLLVLYSAKSVLYSSLFLGVFCMWLTVESLSQFRSVDRILKLFFLDFFSRFSSIEWNWFFSFLVSPLFLSSVDFTFTRFFFSLALFSFLFYTFPSLLP